MAGLASAIAAGSALAGISLSTAADVSGGPAIVLVMAGVAVLSLASRAWAPQ
jgi:hypothetical protein